MMSNGPAVDAIAPCGLPLARPTTSPRESKNISPTRPKHDPDDEGKAQLGKKTLCGFHAKTDEVFASAPGKCAKNEAGTSRSLLLIYKAGARS